MSADRKPTPTETENSMIGITNYIRNDLEGSYTAELLRGAISMLLAVILVALTDLGEAKAYILIVALNGLRSMTGSTLPRRLLNMAVSLTILVLTIGLSIYLGHHHFYPAQITVCIILCAATVYALKHWKAASGTVMFMSVFNIVNFGMGLLDVNLEVTPKNFSIAASLGSLCVMLSVLAVPVLRFHWCLLINHCFYHDLRRYTTLLSKNSYYDSFSELTEKAKNELLMLQTSLYNITKHVEDTGRREKYLRIINGIVLITYWPTTSTDREHVIHINNIRQGIFSRISRLLAAHRKNTVLTGISELYDYRKTIHDGPADPFCNGEMIAHTSNVITAICELKLNELAESESSSDKESLNAPLSGNDMEGHHD